MSNKSNVISSGIETQDLIQPLDSARGDNLKPTLQITF